jgi:hypothetical protein
MHADARPSAPAAAQAYVRRKIEDGDAAALGSPQRSAPGELTSAHRSTSAPAARSDALRSPTAAAHDARSAAQPLVNFASSAFAPPSPTPSSPQPTARARGSMANALGPLRLPGAPPSAPPPAYDPLPGLPPRVRAALRSSASMALASAAGTARSLHGALDARDAGALQQERLFALHSQWAARFKEMRQRRSGLFFTLPILLLSMRMW